MTVQSVNSPAGRVSIRSIEERQKGGNVFSPAAERRIDASSSSFDHGVPVREGSSDAGVVSRVMADIDAVGSLPAKVSVYSQPMGRSIMTDVVVHQTDNDDGTRKVGNHWQVGPSGSGPSPQEGLGATGLRVGAYEESRMAAREAYMMFQGMKVNQTV